MPDIDNLENVVSDDQGQAPKGGEGQAPEQKGPIFTALDESLMDETNDAAADESDDNPSDEGDDDTPKEEGDDQQPPEEGQDLQKRVQTPEENAYYAELRRQREAAQRQAEIQQQIELMRQTMPEFQLAQLLQQQYGKTPQEILSALKEAQLAQEAQQLGISPQQLAWQRQQEEQLYQQQAFLAQQQQFIQMQSLMARLQAEGADVRQKYPQLTPDDLTDAVIWAYENRTLHLPLETLVRARHADKLFAVQQQDARQQALAQVRNRMEQSPLPPQGGKAPTTTTLTPEELFFAKKMGISPEDYARHK